MVNTSSLEINTNTEPSSNRFASDCPRFNDVAKRETTRAISVDVNDNVRVCDSGKDSVVFNYNVKEVKDRSTRNRIKNLLEK